MRRILPLVALASFLTASGLTANGAMAQQSIGGMPGNMPPGMSQQLPPGMTPAQAQQMQQQMQQRGGMYGQQQPGQTRVPNGMGSPMERQQTAQADMTPIGQPPSAAPDPSNCGTPYEPKACPPMPRAPLSNYPASK